MNLPETYLTKSYPTRRGFTLVELLLVIALMSVMGAAMLPYGLSLYHRELVNETSESLRSSLRRAQSFSITYKDESLHGIKLLSGSYVVFQGDSYDEREQSADESIIIPETIVMSGPDEVVFEAFTGTPYATGTYEVSYRNRTDSIRVDEVGMITY